ncbi:uncharacterized protein LOC133197140 [Saccostrea echinata]|uniref:uncharacterized protein LOC133197140 n=1 Tax=Saccostrea echinata TaxID=191078 RepID=UPI002A7FAF9D|nr:uncharacterized protein LOC133197140 [Saccostrea echinata]
MQGTRVLLLISLIKFVYGCEPFVYHDQSSYCNADYAFSGIVQDSQETDKESIFQVQVTSNIKGQVAYKGGIITVYGRGRMNSCGPTWLRLNKEYILYVSIDDELTNKLQITEPHEFNQTIINRIKSYDCYCKVEINLPQQSIPDSSIPAREKCVITEREWDCTFQNGYCARTRCRGQSRCGSGECQWFPGVSIC